MTDQLIGWLIDWLILHSAILCFRADWLRRLPPAARASERVTAALQRLTQLTALSPEVRVVRVSTQRRHLSQLRSYVRVEVDVLGCPS